MSVVVGIIHPMLCLIVVWDGLCILESRDESGAIGIYHVMISLMVFHQSKNSMTRHDFCYIFFLFLTMDEKLDPIQNLIQFLAMANLLSCKIFVDLLTKNQNWPHPFSLGFARACQNTPFSFITSIPFYTENPLSIVTTLLEFNKLQLIQSIRPTVFPRSSNSFGPNCGDQSFPSTFHQQHETSSAPLAINLHCRLCDIHCQMDVAS